MSQSSYAVKIRFVIRIDDRMNNIQQTLNEVGTY